MATKIFCDGCDKNITSGGIKVSAVFKVNGEFVAAGGEYDLCDNCRDHLLRSSNPNGWARTPKAA